MVAWAAGMRPVVGAKVAHNRGVAPTRVCAAARLCAAGAVAPLPLCTAHNHLGRGDYRQSVLAMSHSDKCFCLRHTPNNAS